MNNTLYPSLHNQQLDDSIWFAMRPSRAVPASLRQPLKALCKLNEHYEGTRGGGGYFSVVASGYRTCILELKSTENTISKMVWSLLRPEEDTPISGQEPSLQFWKSFSVVRLAAAAVKASAGWAQWINGRGGALEIFIIHNRNVSDSLVLEIVLFCWAQIPLAQSLELLLRVNRSRPQQTFRLLLFLIG